MCRLVRDLYATKKICYTYIMKKIFLILVLVFFPIKSFALFPKFDSDKLGIDSTKIMRYIDLLVKYILFVLKYFDYYLIKKSAAYDSASAFYFIGKKSDKKLTDRDLIKKYIGFS